jgi:hypothetical protein
VGVGGVWGPRWVGESAGAWRGGSAVEGWGVREIRFGRARSTRGGELWGVGWVGWGLGCGVGGVMGGGGCLSWCRGKLLLVEL